MIIDLFFVSRNKQHEVSVKKPPEVEEMALQGSLDSLDNDSSASVRSN